MLRVSSFPADVNVEKPDEKSIVTYLATLCDTLESEKAKSTKRPGSPTKTAPKKPSSPSPSAKGAGSRTLSPEPSSPEEHTKQLKRSPSPVRTKAKESTSAASSPTKGGEGKTVRSSPSPPKKQTEQSRKSPSPMKTERTSSPTVKGKAQGKVSTSNLTGVSQESAKSEIPSSKSSTSDEPMDMSLGKDTNLSPHKRRDARSVSPSPTSAAPKKPRVSLTHGKLSASSDHSDRLKNKRHSLAVESKKLSVPSESGRKKRASVTGTLLTSRKLSSAGSTTMDVESSSSDLEESEVSRH